MGADVGWWERKSWRRLVRDRGHIAATGEGLRLLNDGARAEHYTDAQIDDYQALARRDFLWQPPLRLQVRARFSHEGAAPDLAADAPVLRGTAGFGFWNDPFLMTERRPPALPAAVWFFYASPPSDMKLDLATPGWGWKAACLDAARWPVRLLLPLAPLALLAAPLMRIDSLYQRTWPAAQRLIHACEAPVTARMTEWHAYEIRWEPGHVAFVVDGRIVLDCRLAIRGPLGMVIWIDNQYLVATPQGRFRYGLLDIPGTQWLELESVEVVGAMRSNKITGKSSDP